MNSVIQTAFDSWTPPVATIAMLFLTAAIYARGFHRLHRQMRSRFLVWRLATFMAGMATLFIAVASPLEELDDLLLQIHMTQHLLLMLVAPSLLLAGAPAIAIVRGLPPRIAKAVVGPIFRSSAVRRPLRLADAATGMLDRVRCRDLGMASAGHISARAALRRVARDRARMLLDNRADVLVPRHPTMASAARWPRWAMIPYLLLGGRAEYRPRRAFHVFRSVDLSFLCDRTARRGIYAARRSDCRRGYHVGARFDVLSRARRANHVSDARAAKPVAPIRA